MINQVIENKNLSILIIDDCLEDIEKYKRCFQSDKDKMYTLYTSETGTEGIEKCQSVLPDCILIDYRLPDLTGLEIVRSIHDRFGPTKFPIVILTGFGDECLAVEAMKLGCQDYLPKSEITSETLFNSVQSAIQAVSNQRKNNSQRIELERLARFDELTGLFNRRTIMEIIEREHQRTIRFQKQACVILLDIDFFKQINDTHGHFIGDVVLRETGRTLLDSIRAIDSAGRFGGEEFLVILPETGRDGAIIIAERIRRRISRKLHMNNEGEKIRVTCSLGISSLNGNDFSVHELLEQADRALYQAKGNGRNRICWHEVSKQQTFDGAGK